MGCTPIRLLRSWRGVGFGVTSTLLMSGSLSSFFMASRIRFTASALRPRMGLPTVGRNVRFARSLVNQVPELARLIEHDRIISVVSPDRKVPFTTSHKISMEVRHPKVEHSCHFIRLSYTLHAYPLAVVRKEPIIRLKFLCTSPTLVKHVEWMLGRCTNLPVSYLKDKNWGNSYEDLLDNFRLDWPIWGLVWSRQDADRLVETIRWLVRQMVSECVSPPRSRFRPELDTLQRLRLHLFRKFYFSIGQILVGPFCGLHSQPVLLGHV